MANKAHTQKQIENVERRLKAFEMRKAGATYDEIATAVGYKSRAGAYGAVVSGLKMTMQEPADAVRHMEVARLDALIKAIWERRNTLEGVDRILKIMERRAKLLGLDVSVPQELTNLNVDMSTLSIQQLERIANGENIFSVLASQSIG